MTDPYDGKTSAYLPDEVAAMPASSVLVYTAIGNADADWVTIDTLLARTGLSPRGIRIAAGRLEDAGYIEEGFQAGDARKRQYRIV